MSMWLCPSCTVVWLDLSVPGATVNPSARGNFKRLSSALIQIFVHTQRLNTLIVHGNVSNSLFQLIQHLSIHQQKFLPLTVFVIVKIADNSFALWVWYWSVSKMFFTEIFQFLLQDICIFNLNIVEFERSWLDAAGRISSMSYSNILSLSLTTQTSFPINSMVWIWRS